MAVKIQKGATTVCFTGPIGQVGNKTAGLWKIFTDLVIFFFLQINNSGKQQLQFCQFELFTVIFYQVYSLILTVHKLKLDINSQVFEKLENICCCALYSV